MVEADEVQGNVLRSHGVKFTCARHLLFRLSERAGTRRTVAGWMEKVSFGRPPDDSNVRFNIAFTYRGLKMLGVPEHVLGAFPDDFREGPREDKRAAANGDTTSDWHAGLREGGHVLVSIHATSPEAAEAAVDALLDERGEPVKRAHMTHVLRAGTPPEQDAASSKPGSCNAEHVREHFGFTDGCSQPAVEGVDADPTGDGVFARVPQWNWEPARRLRHLAEDVGVRQVPRRWRPIRAGEFLLGYEDEEGRLPTGPSGPLGRNGTFMVYRVIEQYPDAFETYVKEQVENVNAQLESVRKEAKRAGREVRALEVDSQWLKAKIVGRWPDGTPLALSPERPDTTIAADRRRANDFLYRERRDGYRDDPHGFACPLGAHVRRANPRDALPGGSERSMRHRIIRRGMPYCDTYDGRVEKGLAFICYGASISAGFEFIQRRWINSGEAFGLGSDPDLLLQQGGAHSRMVIPISGSRSVVLEAPDKPFTTVRGCEYLFVPSRTGCEWLAHL